VSAGTLGAAAHIGGVTLQVGSLVRSLAFYRDLLGFTEIGRADGGVSLGISLGVPGGTRPLVTLVESAGAKPVPPNRRLGLFHFAILLSSRADLAGALAHLHSHGVPLGMSDHLVSEALYLSDPDGLGIEIYADRPRASWTKHGDELAMATEPLDVEGLMREPGVSEWRGMPAGTTIGHMHLHVGDIPGAERFYADVIGFDVVVRRYPGALFLSAGGYHHHLGTNTWARGATAPASDEAQLLHWELVVKDRAEVQAIGERIRSSGGTILDDGAGAIIARDPFGTAVRIVGEG
jgi:catechol 2,3-dioxygenase